MRTRAKLRQVGGGGAREKKSKLESFSRNKNGEPDGGPGQGWDPPPEHATEAEPMGSCYAVAAAFLRRCRSDQSSCLILVRISWGGPRHSGWEKKFSWLPEHILGALLPRSLAEKERKKKERCGFRLLLSLPFPFPLELYLVPELYSSRIQEFQKKTFFQSLLDS